MFGRYAANSVGILNKRTLTSLP